MSEWASDRFTIDVECEEWAKALPYIISYQCSYQLYIVHYTQGTTVYILNFTRGLGGKKMKLYMCSCTCLKIWLCIGIALLTGGAVMLYVKYRPRITKKETNNNSAALLLPQQRSHQLQYDIFFTSFWFW